MVTLLTNIGFPFKPSYYPFTTPSVGLVEGMGSLSLFECDKRQLLPPYQLPSPSLCLALNEGHPLLVVRATAPQLIRYTHGPGRSLNYCMSQRYRDLRGHEPELTAGRYAPKGGSPMESPHNQHLRLKGKARYIDKRRDIWPLVRLATEDKERGRIS